MSDKWQLIYVKLKHLPVLHVCFYHVLLLCVLTVVSRVIVPGLLCHRRGKFDQCNEADNW